MTDSTNLIRLIKQIQPDEIYNLAAMSHVGVSFEVPEYVADTDGIGTLKFLKLFDFGTQKQNSNLSSLNI